MPGLMLLSHPGTVTPPTFSSTFHGSGVQAEEKAET